MSDSTQRELTALRRKLDALMKKDETFVSFEGMQLKLDLSGYLRSDKGKQSLDRAMSLSKKFTPKPAKAVETKKPALSKENRLARAS